MFVFVHLLTHIQLSITKDFTLVSLIVFLRSRRVDQIFGLLLEYLLVSNLYEIVTTICRVTFYEYLLYTTIVMLR